MLPKGCTSCPVTCPAPGGGFGGAREQQDNYVINEKAAFFLVKANITDMSGRYRAAKQFKVHLPPLQRTQGEHIESIHYSAWPAFLFPVPNRALDCLVKLVFAFSCSSTDGQCAVKRDFYPRLSPREVGPEAVLQ